MLATRTVPAFCRSFSETAATMRQKMQIMNACQRADSMNNLTADFSREMALPTMISGTKHQDLPSIDCHTLADVLKGAYAHKIDCVRIVDARYKYEYDGGHINGAENWGHWEEEAFWAEFLPPGTGPKRRRNQRPRAEDGAEDARGQQQSLRFRRRRRRPRRERERGEGVPEQGQAGDHHLPLRVLVGEGSGPDEGPEVARPGGQQAHVS